MTALTTQRYAYPKPKTTEYGPTAKGSVAEGATAVRTGPSVANPTELVHFENPEHAGRAWCGAPVQGVYVKDEVECSVCAALWEAL